MFATNYKLSVPQGFEQTPSRWSWRGDVRARALSLSLVAIIVFCALVSPVSAATKVDVLATDQPEGFGRIVLTFEEMPEYQVRVVSGVLVINLSGEFTAKLDNTTLKAHDFIVVGRADPDGGAFRFALAQSVRINTIEAGKQLFIDLLPSNWSGLPPGLPAEVVAELARRAEEAEEAARAEAQREAMRNSQNKLLIRVGEHPTFSRIVFEWNVDIAASVARFDNSITVSFDKFARAPMGRLRADPPRYVEFAEAVASDSGLGIRIDVVEGASIRAFREEQTYVVDILAPYGAVENNNVPLGGVVQPGGDVPAAASGVVQLNGATSTREPEPPVRQPPVQDAAAAMPSSTAVQAPTAAAPLSEVAPVPEAEVVVTERPAAVAAEASRPEARPEEPDIPHDEVPDVVVSAFYLNADGTGLASEDEPLVAANAPEPQPVAEARPEPESVPGAADASGDGDEEAAVDVPAEPVAAPEVEAAEAPVAAPAATDEPSEPLVAYTEREGATLRVIFPFDRPIASAVFRRSEFLWIVLDSDRIVDLSALRSRGNDHLRSVGVMRSGDSQLLRLRLRDRIFGSASSDGNSWILSLGDTIVTPAAPVSLKRGLRSDGRSKVTVEFENVGRAHIIRDPEIGDRVTVVTGFGPQRGIIKPQEFVEFSVLQTAHGLAIKSKTDDLMVRLIEDSVLITRASGLTLSSGRMSTTGARPGSMIDATRPGFIDYDRWASDDQAFMHQLAALENAITSVEPSQTLSSRLDLARLFLANALGAEALGQLELIGEMDPELRSDPMFAAMRGIARVLMRQPDAARPDLAVFGLSDDPHTSLWRGVLETQARNWADAVEQFHKGEHGIAEYPDLAQARFRLAAARASIEMNDFATADLHLKSMPKMELSERVNAEVQVLQGRLLDGLGRSFEAIEMLEAAISGGDLKSEAEAIYHHTLISHRLGEMEREQVRARLETLSVIWRGDDLELNALRQLAEFYVEDDDFRLALDVMKTAVTNYPEAEISREIHDDMTALFENLFLSDQADAMGPVDALALYYDYRELTPVGRRGDEMIRNLADRLIAVDLLVQAAEILEHQVDKRLIGAARAQVAAKLALIYMMNRDPSRALQIIRRTRQGVLPQHVQTQRRLIEARALTELQQTDAAVDLLANVDGDDALRLRAEAYWAGERWQPAGESFERLLGEQNEDEGDLTPIQRVDVLRSAIAYVFANDSLGLGRLQEKFAGKMEGTPDEHAFQAVTGTIDRETVAFRNLAKEIAAIDTLESFLKEIRDSLDTPLVGANLSN